MLFIKILSLIFARNVVKWKLVLYRVWLNGHWFGSHSKILNFHNWTPCYNELFYNNRRKWKSMDLSMDLWHSNNMKVILPNFAMDHCLWILGCIPFSCIDYFHILLSNYQKTCLNLQLCRRGSIKFILFFCPFVYPSVCDAFFSGSTPWIF